MRASGGGCTRLPGGRRSGWGTPPPGPPYPLTPAPPPLPHHAPSARGRLFPGSGCLAAPGKGDSWWGEEKGTREGARPGEGRRGRGRAECAGPRAADAGRAARWGQAWTPGCGREFLPRSGHLPCRPSFGPDTASGPHEAGPAPGFHQHSRNVAAETAGPHLRAGDYSHKQEHWPIFPALTASPGPR